MAIASYTDIISLTRAKNYLRIDDTLTEDNSDIEAMIVAACEFIEKQTNHILKDRNIEVFTGDRCAVTVYDYPINEVITAANVEVVKWPLKQVFTFDDLDGEPFIYNAGYTSVDDIPKSLINAALQMIKVWYYESEKQVNESLIPLSVTQVIDTYRRFR